MLRRLLLSLSSSCILLLLLARHGLQMRLRLRQTGLLFSDVDSSLQEGEGGTDG